ncbi:unnamed protein product [Phytophthora fragariaefolia]|uniref:Unnamed protein product n=1 Tax=Phytophthora fragariaefolia TaxID=1490495 RepID=A0A9W7D2N7_9STRA|nr:unnamed protein product [Phytophthora fragariaefolia]
MAPSTTQALEVFSEREQFSENLSILTYTQEEEVHEYFDAEWDDQDVIPTPRSRSASQPSQDGHSSGDPGRALLARGTIVTSSVSTKRAGHRPQQRYWRPAQSRTLPLGQHEDNFGGGDGTPELGGSILVDAAKCSSSPCISYHSAIDSKEDMSKKAISSTTSPAAGASAETSNNDGANAAKGAATGAAAGLGLWGLAMPAVNLIGFTTSGIASGSAAASMMSAAAVANGGGVASGSAVAIMQSIGAVGLATPVGLGLVAGGAAVGGAVFFLTSKLSTPSGEAESGTGADAEVEAAEKGLWVLVEVSPDSGKPEVRTFDDDYKARNAFLNSTASSKVLFDPEQKIVLELGWKQ